MIVQQLLVAVSLCVRTHAAAPDLPPAAQVHHDQAIVYVDADDYLAAAGDCPQWTSEAGSPALKSG